MTVLDDERDGQDDEAHTRDASATIERDDGHAVSGAADSSGAYLRLNFLA